MLLVLDVGNTNTVLGLYDVAHEPHTLVANWRVSTSKTNTVDEYGVLFRNLFSMQDVPAHAVTGIIISSVVPPIDSTMRAVCERYFKLKPLFVEPGIKTGMPVHVDNPNEVGADRIVNGVAALEKYGGPCIVVDFGT
ncbi:MAG TPA: type III pantothenate kinase, partial [Terriglobales bacterium]